MAKQKSADEAQTTKPKTVKTVSKTFQLLGVKSHNNRKELAKDIVAEMAKNGVTTNVRGHTIKEEKVLQQISAMIRDITQERGKKTNSWWSTFTVEETDKLFRLVLKKA